MKALILNSGRGSRMGDLTAEQPKCMSELGPKETILSRQLELLALAGVKEVILTTGYKDEVLRDYCKKLKLKKMKLEFVKNERYEETNYIYSIYCARELLSNLKEDLLLVHGDLVFEARVLAELLSTPGSAMAVSSALSLPEKDFKAVIAGGTRDSHITAVGVEFFEDAMAAQPLYKLTAADWQQWLDRIVAYCESGDPAKQTCYAEKALNEVLSEGLVLHPTNYRSMLCAEIDNADELRWLGARVKELEGR